MPDYQKAVQEAARVLKQEGRILVLEFAVPKNPFVRVFYRLYMHGVIPFLGGLLSERSAYEYLGKSIEEFTRSVDVVRLLESSGLRDARALPFMFDAVVLYMAKK